MYRFLWRLIVGRGSSCILNFMSSVNQVTLSTGDVDEYIVEAKW